MGSRDHRLEVLLETWGIKYLLLPSFVDKRGSIMCSKVSISCVSVSSITCNSS